VVSATAVGVAPTPAKRSEIQYPVDADDVEP
jgi:hypothetical protein